MLSTHAVLTGTRSNVILEGEVSVLPPWTLICRPSHNERPKQHPTLLSMTERGVCSASICDYTVKRHHCVQHHLNKQCLFCVYIIWAHCSFPWLFLIQWNHWNIECLKKHKTAIFLLTLGGGIWSWWAEGCAATVLRGGNPPHACDSLHSSIANFLIPTLPNSAPSRRRCCREWGVEAGLQGSPLTFWKP